MKCPHYLFLETYLGLDSLALPVLAHSRLSLVSISEEGLLPEIALSSASKLASTLYFLYHLIEVYMCYILKMYNYRVGSCFITGLNHHKIQTQIRTCMCG